MTKSYDDHFKTLVSDCEIKYGYYLQYGYSNFFEKNGDFKLIEEYEFCDGLFKGNILYPAKKLVEAKNRGYVYQAPVKLEF